MKNLFVKHFLYVTFVHHQKSSSLFILFLKGRNGNLQNWYKQLDIEHSRWFMIRLNLQFDLNSMVLLHVRHGFYLSQLGGSSPSSSRPFPLSTHKFFSV